MEMIAAAGPVCYRSHTGCVSVTKMISVSLHPRAGLLDVADFVPQLEAAEMNNIASSLDSHYQFQMYDVIEKHNSDPFEIDVSSNKLCTEKLYTRILTCPNLPM